VAEAFPGPVFWTAEAYREGPEAVHKLLAGPESEALIRRRAAPIKAEGPWRPWSDEEAGRLRRRWRDDIRAIRAMGHRVMTAPGELRRPSAQATQSAPAAARGGTG